MEREQKNKKESFMFCKLFRAFVFLHTTTIIYASQLKEIQQLHSAVERRDIAAVQTKFRDFFAFWKACNNPTILRQISNDVELYQLCIDILSSKTWAEYIGLSTGEYKKLTKLEQEQINMHGMMLAVLAVGYLEKNPIAIEFSEKLKKESKNSDKFQILLSLWNETLNGFQHEKFAVEAKKITETQNILPYFISLLKEEKYLNDVKSQYILTLISSKPELLTKNSSFKQNKERITNLIEQKFMHLSKDPENTHDTQWRGQQAFILLHQYCSSLQRHRLWIQKIAGMGILSSKLKEKLCRGDN